MAVSIRYFISLLSSAVSSEAPPSAPDDTDWRGMFALAKLHSVEALVYTVIQKLDTKPPEEILSLFEKAYLTSIKLDTVQRSESAKITALCEKLGIDIMPLKGLIMKKLYPAEFLRTMCDMDILFRKEDSQRVYDALTSLGYTADELGGNPEVYSKKPAVSIEMHKALIQDKTDHFETSWSRAEKKDGYSHIYSMNREDFYIFMMAHLKKHYGGNGIGVRSVLDIWLYEKEYGASLDREYINERFEKSGFGDFPEKILKISRIWFSGEEPDPELYQMEAHMITSGTYGFDRFSQDEYISEQVKNKGKVRYALSLLFPPKDVMKVKFPFVEKLPFLLPLAWLCRAFSSCIFSAKKSLKLLAKVFKK